MSTDEKTIAKKAKQHTVYKTADACRVPGVTTITGVMDKPALIKWANGLGLKGIDSTKYVDELARVGTLAHAGIHAHLTGTEWNTADSSETQISMASNGIIKWHYWADKQSIEVIGSEKIMVSEKHRYGGTCDVYCILNGRRTLLDIKTGKGIYDEMSTQVAGYKILLEENGCRVDDCMIVRIGRSDDEGTEPEVRLISNIELHVQRFLICLDLYRINAKIRKDA